MFWTIGAFVAFIGLAARKAFGESSRMPIDVNLDDPSITQWEPFVRIAAKAAGVPFEYAMAYLGVESGGNPCAVGERTALGPDGSPKEIGLFQLYNPDDLKVLNATGSELRAYCVKPAPGQPDPQKLSRKMTPQEIGRHIGLGMGLIKRDRAKAEALLAANGVDWQPTSKDFWRFVKLRHALPVIASPGLANVTKKLGRSPVSWREFRKTYEEINPRARFKPGVKKQDGYYRALENAEWTGGHVIEPTKDANV